MHRTFLCGIGWMHSVSQKGAGGGGIVAALRYMTLNLMQIYDVLRSAQVLCLCVCGDDQPYAVPMHCQLEVIHSKVVLHLASPDTGRKMDALRRNRRACGLILQPGCGWVDSVIVTGHVHRGLTEDAGVELLLRGDELSGRRYFLP